MAIFALTLGAMLGAWAENVAEVTIGSTTTQYGDLGTAWSACSGQNATLKLLKDVDITSVLNKSWTTDLSLDLGGHTLKQTGNNRIIQVLGKMTVSNGVLTRSGSAYSGNGAGIYVCYNDDVDISKFVMRGVTMTNCVTTSDGGAIYAAKNTQVMLENCTLRQNGADGYGGAICTEGGATADGETSKDPLDKLALISTVVTDNTAGTSGAGVYYKRTVKGNSCFAAGTKVLMADGSEKVIEEVEEGDIVRTFDHEGGTNSTARVFMTVKEATTTQIFVLTFADGYGVRCVLSHDFLMKDGDACTYVCLSRENAADYVGKSFYATDGKWHELLSVADGETVNEVYEIYSAQHLNSYADGLLTVPADVAHVLNIYKLGADLKADAEALAADIAAYGLAEFSEISSKYGVSREYYDAFGVKYGHVIVGKGLATRAQIEALYRSAQEDVVSVQPKKTLLKLTTSSNEDDPLKDYPTCNLTLGTGTIVTNNLVGTTPNNIYLEKAGNFYSLIALANDRAGICAGVTPQWTTGQITAFYYANPGDIALFKSDNADYAVWYALGDDGSFLKIDAGSQVVPPTVANTTYEIWNGDEIIAWNEGTTVEKDSNVKVIYTADDGYVFDSSSATTKEVTVNTSTSVATMTPPDAPFEPAASVTASGVTTVYGTLTSAWAEAVKNAGSGATLTMLKDATVESTLTTTGSSGTLTLDLNDHVLAYAGQSGSLITQDGGTLHVVDSATTRSLHYFTCDETTGLWTLTNEETDLSVKGGLLTGARNSAIYYFGGVHSVSNVNFVGNTSTLNGGALTTFNAFIELTITDCTFLGNVAAENGGAVSCGNVTMTDCVVERNVAAKTGGGVYVRDHGSLVRTKVVGNKVVGEDSVGGGVYVTFSPGGCFPAGVKILMADGTEKAVEEIAEGDAVATFDHEGGVKASAAVFYVYKGTDAQDVFTLSFASGATLDIADRHDLLLEATRKYVTVAYDNARSFIGSRFYNYATGDWDTLTGVKSTQGGSAYYSLYTRGHINCVANGILTLADDVDFYLNVYELDENLKADAEILAADIATYGLATPEEYPNIPLDDFMDSNMRYARIAIAKGLTTQAEIRYWNEFDYGPVVAKRAKGALKLTTSSVETVSPTAVYLRVGEGTVITGNVNTAGADNAYLDKSNNAVIDILSGTTDLDIGVTLSSGAGVFGWTNDVNYASSFTSDNPDYEVVYTADKTLELISFVEVIPSVVEHTTAEVYYGETKLTEMPYLVFSNAAPVTVVHVADEGYYFADGTTAKTNTVDTSTNPATAAAPDAPKLPVVAKIGTVEYTDLPTAFSEVKDGETIVMVANVSKLDITAATYMTLAADKAVTFDLAGHSVYGENAIGAQTVMLEVNGDLTIVDSSEGQTGYFGVTPLRPAGYDGGDRYAYGNYLIFIKNGSVTVEGGTLENKGDGSLCYAFEMGEWGNGGDLTVNGGTVRTRAAAVRLYSFNGAPAMSVTVNDGLVDSAQGPAIQYFAPGTTCGRAAIAITGGTVRAAQYTVYAYGTDGGLTIDMTGGTVEATLTDKPAICLYNTNPLSFPGEQSEVSISGGTVVSAGCSLYVYDCYGATQTTISGGTFTGPFFVYTYDNTQSDYFRRDDFCVRVTGGDFWNFDVAEGSDAWFYWSNQSGVLLYGGTYDKQIATDVNYAGRVAEGYIYLDNFNGTWTVVRGKDAEGVPCAMTDETTVVEVETPKDVTKQAWETATNVVATATTTEAPAIVADSELTNAVDQAKQEYGETSVHKLWAEVNVVITPKGATADADDQIIVIKTDVTPTLTTWAEVTVGESVKTNQIGVAERDFEYSGDYMALSFDVSDMTYEPILVIHRHDDGSEDRYTRSEVASLTTFAYDPVAKTITLWMNSFSDLEIYAAVQVGETAYATIDKTGLCTVTGTGDMWSYAKPNQSKLWEHNGVITRVVIEDTVQSVGANAFAYQKGVTDVTIGAGVTNVCKDAFFSCLNVTNLAVGAGVKTVGKSAFGRCNSLTDLSFGSKAVAEACQGTAFKIVARITMNGSTPVIDAVPKVTIAGYTRTLKGAETLAGPWETITDETNIPSKYHFFKYTYEEEQ